MALSNVFDILFGGGFSTPGNFVAGDVLDQIVAYTEPSRSEAGSTLASLYTKYPNFKTTCRTELPKHMRVTSSEINTIFSQLDSNSAATLSTLANSIALKWLEHVNDSRQL